ncbi:hypothetical protein RUND412_008997 [Rhizina undulata]
MQPTLPLLLLLLPLVSSLEWSYFSRFLQQPLSFTSESSTSILSRSILTVNDTNWREILHPTTPIPPATPRSDESKAEVTGDVNVAVKEWFWFFTIPGPSPEVVMHDAVFNKTVLLLSSTTPTPGFTKTTCNTPGTGTVCASFFQSGLRPAYFHILASPARTEIRGIPLPPVDAEALEKGEKEKAVREIAELLRRVQAEQLWRSVKPWSGVWNPVDGALRWAAPVAARIWEIWEKGI